MNDCRRWVFHATLFLCAWAAVGRSAIAQQVAESVVVAEVVERTVAAGQTFVGTLLAVKRSAVGSAVDGRVAEFPVNQGDFVKQGQTLAQLRTETIELDLEAARAELKLRQEELAELENGSRPEEIKQAEAAMLAAQAAMQYQQQRRKRIESLYAQNAVNEDEVQLVVAEAVKAERAFDEAEAAHKLAVDGPRPERIAQAGARVAVQDALVKRLEDQLQKHTIVAPFDGYVVAEHTEVGQWLEQGALVADVVALDSVELEAHVLESHVRHVQKGMSVPVTVPALPDELFTGEVVAVIPQADLRSRTFPVRVRLENSPSESGPLLKAGMLARVTLPTGDNQPARLVPKDALVLGGPHPVVVVVESDPKQPNRKTVRLVPVTLGVAQGERIVVRGQLSAGSHVVVRGNERLRPGQEVVISKTLPADSSAR